MKSTFLRDHWLAVLSAFVFIALAAWLARAGVEGWTRSQIAAHHQRQLAQLSDEGAARLITRLAGADDEYLDVVVLSLADPRPSVSGAAEQALATRLELWSHWPSAESSPRVAALADLLNRSAERIPPTRRRFVQRLAQRMLGWPADGRLVDVPQLIADCERLLRLPLPAAEEMRLAALDESSSAPADPPPGTGFAPTAPPPLTLTPQELPVPATPRVVHPEQPASLPDASRETPAEPRQFIAPRAIRISDDE